MNRISVENPDDDDDRIYLTRPVTTLRLTQLLGLKPYEMLVELMKRNMFANLQTIVPDAVAKEVARDYHRNLIIQEEVPSSPTIWSATRTLGGRSG
jgi:hypothetical protein